MKGKYLVVDKSILPTYYEKVVEAKKLLEDGKAKSVSDAVNQVGISRNSYYKYKDFVMEMGSESRGKRAVISMTLDHEPGVLARIINIIAKFSYSIWTINQNPPMNDQANVVIAIDLEGGDGGLEGMLTEMKEQAGVLNVRLIGVE
ncbi:MAG: ACT domain-containing protein [Mogibacterium sp.]|nr:ACT domain-containing protein [Mogibacterium sp.]